MVGEISRLCVLPRWLAVLIATVPILAAAPAHASFNGSIKFDPEFALAVAAAGAVPGGLFSMLAEVIGARHRPARWVGGISLSIAVVTLLCILRLIGHSNDSGVLMVFLPPLMSLALVSLLPAPVWRFIAVWCVALGVPVLWVLVARGPEAAESADGGLSGLYGGGLVSMLLWHLGFWIGQRWRRVAGLALAEAPDLSAGAFHFANNGLKGLDTLGKRLHLDALDGASAVITWLRARAGVAWWLGGTVAFHIGIAALTALGYQAPFMAMIQAQALAAELFGYTLTGVLDLTTTAWLRNGLAWSALVGCGTWGAAATAGRFDAKQLAPIRFVAVLVAAGALAWIVLLVSTIGFVNKVG